MRRISKIFLIVLALALWCAPALAERRTALVIGNGTYKTASLKNPTNDAQDMAAALSEMGFDVTLKLNASLKDMEEAVRAFGVKLKQGGLGLFYYAGHGVQVAGENYLIPVDTKVEAEADVKFGALNAGMALARMEDAGNDINIVILDACRTNPFARSFRTAEQGLARMDAPKGSLIAYATAPGRVAADSGGNGRNGVYTSFLLQHMRVPGQKVEEILKRVRADVARATKDKQVPWESSSLIGDFYFVSGPKVASLGQPALVAAPLDLAAEKRRNAEEAIRLKREQQELAQVQAEKQRLEAERQKLEQAKQQPPTATQDGDIARYVQLAREAHKRDDFVEALKWYRKTAELGDAKSQFFLGKLYMDGEIVPQDYSEAAKWLKLAGHQGVAMAQERYALLLTEGAGVKKDFAEGLKWYKLAATNGYEWAQLHLGQLYFAGRDVKRDYSEAIKWATMAAEQNNKLAQEVLAACYAFGGDGAEKDYVKSLMWFIVSGIKSKGHPFSDTKSHMLSKMSDTDKETAERLAKEWRSEWSKTAPERTRKFVYGN